MTDMTGAAGSIREILVANAVDPDLVLPSGSTAFSYLEAVVLGALEEIEEVTDGPS